MRQRAVAGGCAHRRRRRADQHDRRTDQPAGAQCDDRGRASRRSRPQFLGGGVQSRGAGRADRQRRPARSGNRYPASRRLLRIPSPQSRKSAARSEGFRKCRRRLPRPSRSRAQRRRRFPGTCKGPRRARRRVRRTSPTCSGGGRSTLARLDPDAVGRQVARRRQQAPEGRGERFPGGVARGLRVDSWSAMEIG